MPREKISASSELLDLIQSDILDSNNNSSNKITSASLSGINDSLDDDVDGRRRMIMARNNVAGTRRSDNDPFRVRLIPHHSTTRYNEEADHGDDENDDEIIIDTNINSTNKRYSNNQNIGIVSKPSKEIQNKTTMTRRNKLPSATSAIRQRMPLGGGYGGMFDSYNTTTNMIDSNINDNDNHHQQTDDQVSNNNNFNDYGDKDDKSSTMDDGSVLTKFFRRNRTQIGIGGSNSSVGSSLNYSLMGSNRRKNKTTKGTLPTKILYYYARLPHRARQFIQLFAFIGTLMIGMMNYLIILDTTSSMPINYHGGREGRGMIMQQYAQKKMKKPF